MDRYLERQVRDRVRGRCEYCRMPQEFDESRFEVEHIIARQHGGKLIEEGVFPPTD